MTTETTEHDSGLDRRALIKKGLVLGGAAAVLPVISTFDTPAFAASAVTGARVQFTVTGVGALGLFVLDAFPRVTPPSTTDPCPANAAAWTVAAADAPGVTVTVTVENNFLLSTSDLLFTITTAGHSFLAGTGNRASGCQQGVIGPATQIRFALSAIDINLSDTVYLIVT